jgi:hypothetical protein
MGRLFCKILTAKCGEFCINSLLFALSIFRNDSHLKDHKSIASNYRTCRTDSWRSRSVTFLSPRWTRFDAHNPRCAQVILGTFLLHYFGLRLPLPFHWRPTHTSICHKSYTTWAIDAVKQSTWRQWQPPTASLLWYSALGPWLRDTSHTTAEGWSYKMLCLCSPQASRLSLI